MSLFAKLQKRAADQRPIRVGLIGAGKFGAMYLAQIPRTPGVHLVEVPIDYGDDDRLLNEAIPELAAAVK